MPSIRHASGPNGVSSTLPSALRLRLEESSDRWAALAAARRLDFGDVDLFHRHHRIERALGYSGIAIGDRFGQCNRRDLPVQAPFVLAPAARALRTAVADDRVPVAIGFGLVS